MTTEAQMREQLPPEGSSLRKLGARLAELLDADQWNNIEPLLFAAHQSATEQMKPLEMHIERLMEEIRVLKNKNEQMKPLVEALEGIMSECRDWQKPVGRSDWKWDCDTPETVKQCYEIAERNLATIEQGGK